MVAYPIESLLDCHGHISNCFFQVLITRAEWSFRAASKKPRGMSKVMLRLLLSQFGIPNFAVTKVLYLSQEKDRFVARKPNRHYSLILHVGADNGADCKFFAPQRWSQ